MLLQSLSHLRQMPGAHCGGLTAGCRVAIGFLLLSGAGTSDAIHAEPPEVAAITANSTSSDMQATDSVASNMAAAATAFLASLNEEQRGLAQLAFDSPARQDWHNIPKPMRKGLQVREMSDAQREHAHTLLKAALSDSGYEKAVRIMSLENNLLAAEQGSGHLRDPLRYFLTIFGTPDRKGVWGWSFEGHHLSLNFVVREGDVIAETPSFWGANPATVGVFVVGGPQVGVRTLAGEEQQAFDLLHSLDEAQLKRAVIAPMAPTEYRYAGVPQLPDVTPEGVPTADFSPEQQELVRKLVTVYQSHLEGPVSERRLAEIEAAGWNELYFAWAGATEPGSGHYFRLQGPTFVLELINVQSDPQGKPANHIHSVWRDVRGDFGVTSTNLSQPE